MCMRDMDRRWSGSVATTGFLRCVVIAAGSLSSQLRWSRPLLSKPARRWGSRSNPATSRSKVSAQHVCVNTHAFRQVDVFTPGNDATVEQTDGQSWIEGTANVRVTGTIGR